MTLLEKGRKDFKPVVQVDRRGSKMLDKTG